VKVIVLEARDRVGGRTCTEKIGQDRLEFVIYLKSIFNKKSTSSAKINIFAKFTNTRIDWLMHIMSLKPINLEYPL
jgi:monoamine oxidase